ncbi:hypothetical protein DPMN_017151 [Dreissena polymorpha]|uniref:C2H2-type domain-containing protein n=1 Tax=Dreissena polymorpha TaxID=45954 RepID=A0A9D4NAW0_DREPO|nr:hypothetical protein DPMN_017151 [Dreissena polymorpha]
MESSKKDQIQSKVCGVALSCAYSLKRHMQLHSDSTYECDYPECGKRFKCKKSLQRHTRSHTDGPKFCSHCGKKFTATYWHNKHKHEIHRGKASKYSCTVFAKPYQSGYALQHLSSHSDEKNTPVKYVRSHTKPHQFFEYTNAALRTMEKESMPRQHAPKHLRQ